MTPFGKGRKHRGDASVGRGGSVKSLDDMIMFRRNLRQVFRWLVSEEWDRPTIILVYDRVSEGWTGAAAASHSLLRRWRRWRWPGICERLDVGQRRERWWVVRHRHDEACAS